MQEVTTCVIAEVSGVAQASWRFKAKFKYKAFLKLLFFSLCLILAFQFIGFIKHPIIKQEPNENLRVY